MSLSSKAKWAARGLANRLRTFAEVEPEGFSLSDVPRAQVALYFADMPSKLYQLTQWLPVFERRTDVTTIVVLRNVETYNALAGRTSLRTLLVPKYEDLMALYDRAEFHAVVYVNNGWTNFQSLSFQQAVHVHVNHGESDKICMVSNQAKAYDKVFVAGEAAVQRHAAALAWFDPSHLVRVGRPQLDLDVASPLPDYAGPTITYAPTWEGEDDANNYTSVDVYGVDIIDAALSVPNARVVYKPHPRVATSTEPAMRTAHAAMVQRIERAQRDTPDRGHAILLKADVLGVLRSTDLLIADVSSVTLDHLYLRPQSPIVLCDRRSNPVALLGDAPLASAVQVVDRSSLPSLADVLRTLLDHDPQRAARAKMRDFYFDAIAPGESTTRFWTELGRAMSEHDAALGSLSRVRTVTEGTA